MRPKMKQLGLMPELDGKDPADYRDKVNDSLNQLVLMEVKKARCDGAIAADLARSMCRPQKSIAGRLTELHQAGLIRATEAKRNGCTVYVAVES